jgi:hypothetical protein
MSIRKLGVLGNRVLNATAKDPRLLPLNFKVELRLSGYINPTVTFGISDSSIFFHTHLAATIADCVDPLPELGLLPLLVLVLVLALAAEETEEEEEEEEETVEEEGSLFDLLGLALDSLMTHGQEA